MEITHSGHQRGKQMKKYESDEKVLWDNIKRTTLHIIGIPRGDEK